MQYEVVEHTIAQLATSKQMDLALSCDRPVLTGEEMNTKYAVDDIDKVKLMFARRVRRLTLRTHGAVGHDRIEARAMKVLTKLPNHEGDLAVSLGKPADLWHEAMAVEDDWSLVFYPDGERCWRALRHWANAFDVLEVEL